MKSANAYKFDLAAVQRLAQRNYASLVKLIPAVGDMVEHDAPARTIKVNEQLAFQLAIINQAAYTTEVRVRQRQGQQTEQQPLLQTDMDVRLYHDAQMAEVVRVNNVRSIKARYDTPNPTMFEADEKRQINRFLADWLQLCHQQGQVVSNACR